MTQTLCLKCMKRFLDIIPQQSPTLPRNCNINTFIRCTYAKISRTRIKTEKQSNASGYTQKFCLCEITFNNSIIFFLYLCHRLCLRFVKCASVTNIINLMHGTVSLAHSLLISKKKCFFAAFKGRVTITTSDFCDKRKNVPNFVGNFFPSTSEIFEFCLKVARSFDWRSFLL